MNPRSLPMLNATGCLILAAVVFTQWSKESRNEEAMAQLRVEVATARDQAETETKRAAGLQHDIEVLKQSLESLQRATIEAASSLQEKERAATGVEGELAAAREQVENWMASIAERDTRIRNLTAELAAARGRLDEAIVKLKQAGAR